MLRPDGVTRSNETDGQGYFGAGAGAPGWAVVAGAVCSSGNVRGYKTITTTTAIATMIQMRRSFMVVSRGDIGAAKSEQCEKSTLRGEQR